MSEITLAVDSAGKAAGIAILRDEVLIYESYLDAGLTHSETLLPMLKSALAATGIAPAEINLYAVSAGPGSFTGLRIGMALAKGLALPNHTPCIGVSTLEALALSVFVPQGSIVVAAEDARRGEVYYAAFEQTAEGLHRLCLDTAGKPCEMQEMLENAKKSVFIVGDGAEVCYNNLEKNLTLTVLPAHLRKGRASGVAFAARAACARGENTDAALLAPEYLKLCQAQRERQEKLKGSETT